MTANQIALLSVPIVLVFGGWALVRFRRKLKAKQPEQKHAPHSGQTPNNPADMARSKMQGHAGGHH